jgi:glycosyltransferase involved in cell wall biosynthesis
MPVYNGGIFIRDALEALLAQSFTDFELIISDNLSTDETEKICREFAARDPRVCYIRQPENRGAVANFEYVLGEAVGDFFMWAAADDLRSPECIELYLENIGNAGGVFSTYAVFDRKDSSVNILPVPLLSSANSRQKNLSLFFQCLTTSAIYGLFRRNVLLELFNGRSFDWFDSYLLICIISKYGLNTFKTDKPAYLAGIYGSYVVKPFHGDYLNPWRYFCAALPFAVLGGPTALLSHFKVIAVSYFINIRLLQKKING